MSVTSRSAARYVVVGIDCRCGPVGSASGTAVTNSGDSTLDTTDVLSSAHVIERDDTLVRSVPRCAQSATTRRFGLGRGHECLAQCSASAHTSHRQQCERAALFLT